MLLEFLVVVITGLVLLFAYKKKKISISAVILTAVIGFSVLMCGGVWWVGVLLGFFILGNLISSYKKGLKKDRGCEQEIRTWRNVYGNGMSAMVFALCNCLFPDPMWFYAMYAAMTAATADTFSTEGGQVFGKSPRKITTLGRVDVGTSGAVSWQGFLSGAVGGLLITLPLVGSEFWWVVFVCGVLGSVIDSVMGATLEEWGLINTHDVNFLSTLFAGVVFVLVLRIPFLFPVFFL